jgi:hypothetical protein
METLLQARDESGRAERAADALGLIRGADEPLLVLSGAMGPQGNGPQMGHSGAEMVVSHISLDDK